jgi:hypothetical protein
MNMSLVLIHQALGRSEAESLIKCCGHEILGELANDVPAGHVASYASTVGDQQEVVRVAVEGGWTVLADESGRLPEARATWREASVQQGVASLSLISEPDLVAFAWHGADGQSRAVAVADDARRESGDALAIERSFAGNGPSSGDLLLLAQSVGVDLARLNDRARFRLLACVSLASGVSEAG